MIFILDLNETKKSSKILQFMKTISFLTIKEYLISQLKDCKVINFQALIKCDPLKKSYYFMIIDDFLGEKMKILIKITQEKELEVKFSYYLLEEKMNNENLNIIKYYIENKISRGLF